MSEENSFLHASLMESLWFLTNRVFVEKTCILYKVHSLTLTI